MVALRLTLYSLLLTLVTSNLTLAAELEEIRISDDGQSFVKSASGERYIPWGFNYDHEGDGRLLEDYWREEWPVVVDAFQEMKALGANVVRIHLQFGKFMRDPDTPDRQALDQLQQLVALAESTGLYLDLTGLGCYHKQDVPKWYHEMDEQERWQAQANFWEAIAQTCAESPAIFCYDLMNEPVVPGGDKKQENWLGPGFGGKHFVQFITRDRKGRERTEIARQWIHHLVTAIRKHDDRHLITVGLVPWSLDRPGLTSGFVPEEVTGELDFIAMHIYPEKGKRKEALETVKGFARVGKPVVIEETFPLKCGVEELEKFIEESTQYATGWIGFYWGTTPEEYREKADSIQKALMLGWLKLFQEKRQPIFEKLTTRTSFLENGVTAHRGNSSVFPENTLAAFRSGIDVGADWIELDLFKTKDGKLVVIHDRTTGRVGDRNLDVTDSTYEELRVVDVATGFREQTGQNQQECPPARIPLLSEVLDLVMRQERTRVSIQPKMNCVPEAIHLIREKQAERWVGFNDGNLELMVEVKQLDPEIPVFWDRGVQTDLTQDLRIARKHGFASLVVHQSGITPERIEQIHLAGLGAGAWTVNDAEMMRKFLSMGIDRLYTDAPETLLKLKAHNQSEQLSSLR